MMLRRKSVQGYAALIISTLAFGSHRVSAQSVSSTTVDAPTAAAEAGSMISIDDAISRAEANEPNFAAGMAETRVAQLDRSIARTALLPSATFHNQYLFTQGNGSTDRIGQTTTSSAPRFIANNSVHEYASQAVVNETVGLQQLGAITLANANAARASAELEIARRGLVSAVVNLFYGLVAAESKLETATRANDEATRFVTLTQQREAARESAHADVVKAQLQQQQRGRDVADARLAVTRARLELGVLLFPDPRTDFRTQASPIPVLPDRSDIDAAAAKNDVELKSALASLRAGEAEVSVARAAYLPDLALNFTYGIDAPQLAANGPGGTRNLGYAASATLDIPAWDWLATQHKVKQSQIRRDAIKVMLSATQRRLVASLAEFYDEAATARDQVASLDLSVATAQESFRLMRLRYIGGEGTVLEVVDAQNTLISTEIARADATLRYQVALAGLQTLTGRF